MGVDFGRFSVRRPAGVSDTHAECMRIEPFGLLFEIFEFADRFEGLNIILLQYRNSG